MSYLVLAVLGVFAVVVEYLYHTKVSAKLAAVKAEIAKIEAEAKAEEQAVVARLKAVLS